MELSETIQNEHFSHATLDLSHPHIRLLRIQWCSNDEKQIRCILETFTVHPATENSRDSTCPPYRALSYVWGSADMEESILVNGKTLVVRRNLHDLLRVVSKGARRRRHYYWIDQICINQQCVKERKYFVERMDEIFRNACEVVSWLGKDEDDSEYLFRILASGREQHLPHSRLHRSLSKERREAERIKDAALAFVDRDYWKRAWIIQEVFLARKLRIWCGQQTVEHKRLHKNMQRLSCMISRRGTVYVFLPEDNRIVKVLQNACRPTHPWTWSRIMYSYGHQESSEPRDRVYALQNLIDSQSRIPVDYVAKTGQLLEQAMKAGIDESFRKPQYEPYDCQEDCETLGLVFADALLGRTYPVSVLVILQELAWLLCLSEFIQRRSDILDGYIHLQQFLCLARTPQQRHLADIIQLEVAKLAIQKLGYSSWENLRRGISAEPYKYSFWGNFDTALKNAYSTQLPRWRSPGLSRAYSPKPYRAMQEDLATAVYTAIAVCGYDISEGYIRKLNSLSFIDILDHKVCHWATNETNPQFCTLMCRQRDVYSEKIYEVRRVFYYEYASALGPWGFMVVEKWETRVDFGGDSASLLPCSHYTGTHRSTGVLQSI